MNNCLITVIVPVFNEEKYIDRCIRSLEKQTWKLLQIILVDGGSTDSSPAKCDEWAAHWNKSNMGIVEVIHTSNKGVSASRNKGLAHASGEYVTFVDGDDWLEPNAIESMYDAIANSDVDMSGCEFCSRISEEDGLNTVLVQNNKELKVKTTYNFLWENMLHGDVHCWGRLYKKSILKNQRFQEGLTIGEDMLFLMEYVLKCENIATINNTSYNYYRNPNGAMTKPFTSHTMDQVTCWKLAGELLGKTEIENIRQLSNSAELYGNILISIMLTAGRLAVIDKAIRNDPEHKTYVKQLRKDIKKYKNTESMKIISLIPGAYPFKVRLFSICPNLYLFLYHLRKA